MLGVFIFLLVVSFLIRMYASNQVHMDEDGVSQKTYRRCDENPRDRRHKWVVRPDNSDYRGIYICQTCGKIPGEDE